MFHVEIAAGCYSGADAPVVSRHKTWGAALDRASRNDRLVAVAPGRRAQIECQDDDRFGAGRYGNGLSGPARTAWVRANR